MRYLYLGADAGGGCHKPPFSAVATPAVRFEAVNSSNQSRCHVLMTSTRTRFRCTVMAMSTPGDVTIPALGPLMFDVEAALTKHALSVARGRGSSIEEKDLQNLTRLWPNLSPQVKDELRDLFIIRFALTVGGGLKHLQRENLESARRFGATYAQLSESTGYTRQAIQRRWGLTEKELRDAHSAIADAIAELPPPLTVPADARWNPLPDRHNYDPEAKIWAAEISVERATGSSPKQVLLFHDHEFLGTATDANLGFTELLLAGCTDSVVCVQFPIKDKSKPNAAPPIKVRTVRYRWLNDEVVRFGDDLPDGSSSFARDGRQP